MPSNKVESDEIDDAPFMKDDGVFCAHCPGRKGDHADYCKVPEFVRKAKEQADGEVS